MEGPSLSLPNLDIQKIEDDLSVLAVDEVETAEAPAAPPAPEAAPEAAPVVDDGPFVHTPAKPRKRQITEKQRAHLAQARAKAAEKRSLAAAERAELAALREEKKKYAARTKPSAEPAEPAPAPAPAPEESPTFNDHLPSKQEREKLQQEEDNRRYEAFLGNLARYKGSKARAAPAPAPVAAPAPAPPPQRRVSFNVLQPPRSTRSNYDNWF